MYSWLWLYVPLYYNDNEVLNGSECIWGASATDLDSWKSSKSISHMDLWMLWIQVPSPPPALQHKSLEQYVIWTTAPQWSVEPDDGCKWKSSGGEPTPKASHGVSDNEETLIFFAKCNFVTCCNHKITTTVTCFEQHVQIDCQNTLICDIYSANM